VGVRQTAFTNTKKEKYLHRACDLDHYPVRLPLSARLISRGTVFFFHNKTATADL
jgi:hypothetical protein